jgi:hypothetical protein
MPRKIVFLFLFFQLASMYAQEQNITVKSISTQKTEMDVFVGFDGMGNLYYIKNNVLYKKNNNELWQYKNISLGKITKIDFQNQLKIMLFYENFNTIILLDNQLNEIQKINFSENETPIVVAAASVAGQNSLWLYNSLSQQIGLYDYLKGTFRSITPPFIGIVKYYQSDFNNFYWIDEGLNWYAVDIFGKITTIGKTPEFEQIQIVSSQEIVVAKNGNLFVQNISKGKFFTIENVEKSFKNFYYKDQILAIFTNQGITNYKIKIP